MEVAAERLDHLLRLVLAQQAVVDEHAGELVADRLVHEQRRDRGVDAAREPADARARGRPARGSARPAPRSRPRASRSAARRRRRRGSSSGSPARAACARPRGGTGRRRGRARRPRTRRSASTATTAVTRAPVGGAVDGVAVAHPDGLLGGQVVEERRLAERAASALPNSETPFARRAPPRSLRHQLHPVADAERRDAELEDRRIDLRRAVGVDRRRAAGEDQRERVPRARPRSARRCGG